MIAEAWPFWLLLAILVLALAILWRHLRPSRPMRAKLIVRTNGLGAETRFAIGAVVEH